MAATATQPSDTEILAARVPRRIVDEIESIAAREDENRSTIVRRLLRRALEGERATQATARA
jgi:metal-responsive CopG/Arc/MetJ family transcriptional regulator